MNFCTSLSDTHSGLKKPPPVLPWSKRHAEAALTAPGYFIS
jgi:hypothetical protein